VVNAGVSEMAIPFIGNVNFGLLYPLFLIPLGVAGAGTTFNFLAGYNGLEARQGMLILSGLALVCWLTGTGWLAVICLLMVASLAGFWIFNMNPAKVFPGNSITYAIGGLIACAAIFGNIEKIAVFFFIPYIIEVVLKARGKLRKQSFGKPNKDDSLEMPYDKVYGLEHFAIKMLKRIKTNVYENDVVNFVNIIQLVTIVLGLIIFRTTIF
jgi:UDP-N-acetylglucosamine--dolichyl-phosphate N-acetylglucosaminephosphotransferase